jgi:drug/metabolite transporter (DMT)-like permease
MSAPVGGAPSLAGRLSDDVRGGLLIILGGLCFTLVGAVIKQLGSELRSALALATWEMPDLHQLFLLAAIGAISCVGQVFLSRGYALGQFSKMAPMDFFRLPLAILLGFAVFAELPDLLALVGMAIIVAASLFILLARARA